MNEKNIITKKVPVNFISQRNKTRFSEKPNKYTKFFDYCVRNKCIVHADVSFLMNKVFLDEFYPALVKYNAIHANKCMIKISSSAQDILKNLSAKTGFADKEDAERARRLLSSLGFCAKKGYNFTIYKSEAFINAGILSQIIIDRLDNNVILLTENNKLISDIQEHINILKSCNARKVFIRKHDTFNQNNCTQKKSMAV